LARSDPLDAVTLPVGIRFLGGPICLDFANTTEQLRSETPNDWLTSYEVLLVWSRIRGTLAVGTVERLAHRAGRQRAAAHETFAQACAVRADIRALAGVPRTDARWPGRSLGSTPGWQLCPRSLGSMCRRKDVAATFD